MSTLRRILALFLLFQLAQDAGASDLRVSNVDLKRVPGAGGLLISFDIGWDRSWRDERNWDAAWVFVKYQSVDGPAGPTTRKMEKFDLEPGWVELLDRALMPPDLKQQMRHEGIDFQQVSIEVLKPRSRWQLAVEQKAFWRQGVFERTFLLDKEQKALHLSTLSWEHVDVTAHSAPAGATVESVADQKGVFIFRSEKGAGRVDFKDVELLWELDRDTKSRVNQIDVWIFALEMVFVPSDPFWVGQDNCSASTGPVGCLYDFSARSGAYRIEAENAEIPVCPKEPGSVRPLCYDRNSTGYSGDRKGPIPRAFPKGVDAFYAMKYELTQQQYSDFLNTLPTTFAVQNRFPYVGEGQQGSRLTVFFTPTAGSTLALQPSRAYNWSSWIDNAAYMDWAALRPMTELEFTKASRGTADPVDDEFAWGNSSYVSPAGRIVGPELPFSTLTVNGNVNINDNSFIGGDGGQGPLPGDGFALPRGKYEETLLPSAEATFRGPDLERQPLPFGLGFREVEGRSFYGLTQLSGNLWEMTITIGSPEGRLFEAVNGDGSVTLAGEADVPTWPKRGALGIGFRGGSWLAGNSSGQIANRFQAANAYPVRTPDFGLRAVRNAPRSKTISTSGPPPD